LAATHAVFVLADLIRATIVPLAAAARIPVVYQFSEFVEAGALMTHSPHVIGVADSVSAVCSNKPLIRNDIFQQLISRPTFSQHWLLVSGVA
jgi:hypothetical protein